MELQKLKFNGDMLEERFSLSDYDMPDKVVLELMLYDRDNDSERPTPPPRYRARPDDPNEI